MVGKSVVSNLRYLADFKKGTKVLHISKIMLTFATEIKKQQSKLEYNE